MIFAIIYPTVIHIFYEVTIHMKMRKIEYNYSSAFKQLLLAVIALYVLLYYLVVVEIKVFDIPEYADSILFLRSTIVYLVIFAVLGCLFFAHRFCYSIYTPDELTFYNRLLFRQKTLDFSKVRLAVFDTFGVKFYDKEVSFPITEKPFFTLPFYRGGFIDPVQIDKLHHFLEDSKKIPVVKNYKVLLGYGKSWRLLYAFYIFFTICFIIAGVTPLTAVIVLFLNH